MMVFCIVDVVVEDLRSGAHVVVGGDLGSATRPIGFVSHRASPGGSIPEGEEREPMHGAQTSSERRQIVIDVLAQAVLQLAIERSRTRRHRDHGPATRLAPYDSAAATGELHETRRKREPG
jgi:hypothetical protein